MVRPQIGPGTATLDDASARRADLLYLVTLGAWTLLGPGTQQARPGPEMPPSILALFERMGTGGLKDAFIGNLIFLVGRWADLFASVRFPKVLGMFVLGLWTVRTGLVTSLASHRATLVRWCRLGWALGLPANVIAAWAFLRWSYLPPSAGGLLGVALQGAGIPTLALGYAAGVGLWWWTAAVWWGYLLRWGAWH